MTESTNLPGVPHAYIADLKSDCLGWPVGQIIVKQYLKGVDSVRDFVRGIVMSIANDVGENGLDGMMNSMDNPKRKCWWSTHKSLTLGQTEQLGMERPREDFKGA